MFFVIMLKIIDRALLDTTIMYLFF